MIQTAQLSASNTIINRGNLNHIPIVQNSERTIKMMRGSTLSNGRVSPNPKNGPKYQIKSTNKMKHATVSMNFVTRVENNLLIKDISDLINT